MLAVLYRIFTARRHASAVYAVVLCLSVCLSVTSRCSAETVKRKITQTASHDSPGTLVLWRRRSDQNSNRVTPTEAPNAGGIGWNWGDFRQIICYNSKTSTVANVVNLVHSFAGLSQSSSTFVYSTFAVMQRVVRVHQWQLILCWNVTLNSKR